MSLLDVIHASVAKKQRGFRVQAGNAVLRGDRYVKVLAVDGSTVMWIDVATGIKTKGTLSEFRSEYLERVKAEISMADGALDAAWDVAGARRMAADQRVDILRSIKRGTPAAARKIIDGWIFSLLAGSEPARSGTARDI